MKEEGRMEGRRKEGVEKFFGCCCVSCVVVRGTVGKEGRCDKIFIKLISFYLFIFVINLFTVFLIRILLISRAFTRS